MDSWAPTPPLISSAGPAAIWHVIGSSGAWEAMRPGDMDVVCRSGSGAVHAHGVAERAPFAAVAGVGPTVDLAWKILHDTASGTENSQFRATTDFFQD